MKEYVAQIDSNLKNCNINEKVNSNPLRYNRAFNLRRTEVNKAMLLEKYGPDPPGFTHAKRFITSI